MAGRFLAVVMDGDHKLNVGFDLEREILEPVGVDLRIAAAHTEDEIVEVGRDADALLGFSARVTRAVVAELRRCRIVARYSVGFDSTDLEAATEKGIIVTNVPDYCVSEVSNHTMAFILAAARNLKGYDGDTRGGKFDPLAVRLRRLERSTLGLLGFGRIAREVARKASAFGMRILAHDPYLAEEEILACGATPVELDALLSEADFLSLHVPLASGAGPVLGARELGLMKPTAWLVNTARGALVDEAALVAALRGGRLAGAGLDAFQEEPPGPDSPLLSLENVLLSPHSAWYSEEARYERNRGAAEAVADVLSGRVPRNVVNPAVLSRLRYNPIV